MTTTLKESNPSEGWHLVMACGLHPNIITETVFALCQSDPKYWRSGLKVHVITTRQGGLKLQGSQNFNHDFLQRWKTMLKEYKWPGVSFSIRDIHILKDQHGHVIDDASSVQANAAMGDQIANLIAKLCRSRSHVHVSFAAGRKTQAFYLTYALALHGRLGDELSHTLVHRTYEHSDFWYPSAQWPDPVTGQGDCIDVPVYLIRVPLLLLQTVLGKTKKSAGYLAQIEALKQKPTLVIDLARRQLSWGHGRSLSLDLKQFALYSFITYLSFNGLSFMTNFPSSLLQRQRVGHRDSLNASSQESFEAFQQQWLGLTPDDCLALSDLPAPSLMNRKINTWCDGNPLLAHRFGVFSKRIDVGKSDMPYVITSYQTQSERYQVVWQNESKRDLVATSKSITPKISGQVHLIIILGFSPAILTETLFGLMNEQPIPTKVRISVITTPKLEKSLREFVTDPNQAFNQMLNEFGWHSIISRDIDFLVCADIDKLASSAISPRACLKTDIQLDAKAQCDEVYRAVTQMLSTRYDNEQCIVSISGGRKSMGYAAALALTVSGEESDRLIHVLVDVYYEQAKVGFFYPSKLKLSKSVEDFSEVVVTLTDIAFVPLNSLIAKKDSHLDQFELSKMIELLHHCHQKQAFKLAGSAIFFNELQIDFNRTSSKHLLRTMLLANSLSSVENLLGIEYPPELHSLYQSDFSCSFGLPFIVHKTQDEEVYRPALTHQTDHESTRRQAKAAQKIGLFLTQLYHDDDAEGLGARYKTLQNDVSEINQALKRLTGCSLKVERKVIDIQLPSSAMDDEDSLIWIGLCHTFASGEIMTDASSWHQEHN
jgi:CRISPR-associated protein (TIGR02584 family)